MNEKGIERPPRLSANRLEVGNRGGIFAIFDYLIELVKWAQRLQNTYPKVQTFDVVIDPPNMSADSDATLTVTLNGLTTNDIVYVNKPSVTAGVTIGNCFVSAANTLKIQLRNHNGGAANPPSETWLVVAIRR